MAAEAKLPGHRKPHPSDTRARSDSPSTVEHSDALLVLLGIPFASTMEDPSTFIRVARSSDPLEPPSSPSMASPFEANPSKANPFEASVTLEHSFTFWSVCPELWVVLVCLRRLDLVRQALRC